MLHIAIVEDEDACARQLEEYLQRFQEENGMQISVERFADGMELTERYHPGLDLILLDVEMPRLDGISAAAEIRAQDSAVQMIFITNMAQYAIKGYEVDALDYVLKPVSYYAFSLKLQKALRILRTRGERSLLLKMGSEALRLNVQELYYVEVYNHRLCYHTAGGELTTTGARTLRDVCAELAGAPFALCNNCYLVNLQYVDGVKEDHVLVNGVALKISRGKRREFMQALLNYHKGALG